MSGQGLAEVSPLAIILNRNIYSHSASLVAQMVKNPPAMQETRVQSLGWEDSLEEGMVTHSRILAWRIPHGQRNPWTEERGQRTEEPADYSPWGRKESDMIERLSAHTIHIQLTVLFLQMPFLLLNDQYYLILGQILCLVLSFFQFDSKRLNLGQSTNQTTHQQPTGNILLYFKLCALIHLQENLYSVNEKT